MTMSRACAWCRKLLKTTSRRDQKFCDQRCRQASHRFTRAVAHDVRHDGSTPMRFAYADPPYPGLSRRYYADHPDFAGEVDHERLIEQLSTPGRYDGWALSTSADALPFVLSCCTGETRRVRVAAWVRGGRPHSAPRGPLSSWEPVVFAGGRDGSLRFDSLTHFSRPRTTDPDRVIGAKPAVFARWLFELLGAQPGDELDDLFPGSGGISRAWDLYASCGSNGDVSRGDGDDVSREYSGDTSSGDHRHVSQLQGHDVSLVDDGDESSAAALHYASCEYSGDASCSTTVDEPSARAKCDA